MTWKQVQVLLQLELEALVSGPSKVVDPHTENFLLALSQPKDTSQCQKNSKSSVP
ncbi:hypothetical protein SLEP1_g8811 [Rubroshorea leprosula]|uniref:Uncharacterized protein n=1 Tax=Rubroshorea leprosula TaxID=152421 RepID=A0AAV5IE21_9ROSI|nr:hypothetical protein SLEP1_g8811 [Rubroshorea leprosula]